MDQSINIDLSKKFEIAEKDNTPKATALCANVESDAEVSPVSEQAIDFCGYDESGDYYSGSFGESEVTFYDPFDLYQQIRSELYGQEISDSMEDEFEKLLSGELKTEDVLANAIIKATQIDEYENILSEEELDVFFSELYNNKIEGLDIDELQDDDSNVEDLYQAQNDEMTLKYLNKSAQDCTPEELNQVYALSLAESILKSSTAGLENQDSSDGAISDIFDWFKKETGVETCREDVLAALDKQEAIVASLTDAIKNGNFEEVWRDVTGVEYDPEKVALYQEKITLLNFISENVAAVDGFYNSLLDSENKYNVENTYNSFVEFYGEERGNEKFLDTLKHCYNNNTDSELYDPTNLVEDMRFDEDGNIIVTRQNGDTYVKPLDEVGPSNLTPMYSSKFIKSETQEYLESLEKLLGVNYDSLAQECITLSNETLGEANAVNNVLNEYINSQEKFIDDMACFTQFAGMGTMLIGGTIACIVPGAQGLGLGMIKAGQAMAVMGTFGDEVLEVADKATNERTYEEDLAEYKEILKEFVTDGALFASGYVIGSYSNALGDIVFTETGSKFLSKFADIGLDATMSLLTDMAITGEIDLFGEGLSQFLGIVTGSAFARVNAANAKMMNNANDILVKQDLNAAVRYLESEGASAKTIKNYRIDAEIQRLNYEISIGKILPKNAAMQLQDVGISKKALAQFRKAHGLEYRTPVQLMRDLIVKNRVNGAYAKEATIDYKLSEPEAIKYSEYRESGQTPEQAMKSVERFRIENIEASKYKSINEVYADLNEAQRLNANKILSSAQSKGYGNFVRSHLEMFKNMALSENVSYAELSGEQWAAIKYITDQFDNGTISSEVINAIDSRINGDVYYKIFDYVDNPEAIPPEGIPHPYMEGLYIDKETCIRRIKEEVIPLRDFLDTQSIPYEMKTSRIDSYHVFQNTVIDGVNIGSLMSSGRPEDIQQVLNLLNGNDCGVEYKNFTGTALLGKSETNNSGHECPIIWDLTLPKGTKGAFLETVVPSESAIYSENEFLLQTNSYYQIHSVKYENGRYVISATVIQE